MECASSTVCDAVGMLVPMATLDTFPRDARVESCLSAVGPIVGAASSAWRSGPFASLSAPSTGMRVPSTGEGEGA
eukprot:5585255-Pyramimonas_sp.AAC.1